ncbi:MAG: branched-chain amino acid ABC transporter substrate-binding protein [Xanthobacteraceae bacterium]|nr:branched-chain amino acid ABC transporter substrate-binding protein [Xanthobacteraceae bacterium]
MTCGAVCAIFGCRSGFTAAGSTFEINGSQGKARSGCREGDMKKFGILVAVAVGASLLALAASHNPADAKDKVKVGFIGSLTGGTSANGIGGRNSADLAVRLRNADPKAKYEYEMVSLDDECKPNIGVQVATKLAADKDIIAAATHYCSAVAIATVDTYHKFELPIIVWGAVLPDITYRNKYPEVHRVNGTMINQNQLNATLLTKLGYKTFAVIHDTTDYGKGHNKYFSEALEKAGGKIIGTFGVTSDQQDFTAELTQIKSLNPQVIYFGGLTPIGVRIRAQMDRLGLNNVVFDGTSGIKSDAFIEGLGKFAEGSLSFLEGAPTERLPGGKFFLEKYNAQNYPNPPEAYGAFGFAAMNLILDTIESQGPDRKKVRDALNKVRKIDSIVGEITFDDHGQNTVPIITAYVAQDGKWVVWEDSEYASGKRKLPGQK